MIYIASPYSSPDKAIEHSRYEKVLAVAARFLQQEAYVYSPIVHCHMMALAHKLPGDAAFWRGFDEHMIARAEQLLVLQLDGWGESVEVTHEIHYAESLRIPVLYAKPEQLLL